MRSYYLLTFFALSIAFLLSACQNSSNTANQPKTVPTDATSNPFTNAPSATAPAANTADPGSFSATEPHYKCPNSCAGGGGPAAGNCPVCGTSMVHNQAYHNAAASTTTPPAFSNPEANAPAPAFNSTEPHYKCPNNCAGGHGPAKGNCPVCGTALAHNAAYHNNTPSAPTTPNVTIPGATTTTTASTGQNAAGVYHYTCSNGCAGGAAEGVACATCGATLVHNPAYHN